MIETLSWVRIAIPKGREEMAREFYGDVLGLEETAALESGKTGLWYGRNGAALLRLEGDSQFTPSHLTHPAFTVSDLQEAASRFDEFLFDVEWDDGDQRGFCVYDPFGNRLAFRARE